MERRMERPKKPKREMFDKHGNMTDSGRMRVTIWTAVGFLLLIALAVVVVCINPLIVLFVFLGGVLLVMLTAVGLVIGDALCDFLQERKKEKIEEGEDEDDEDDWDKDTDCNDDCDGDCDSCSFDCWE